MRIKITEKNVQAAISDYLSIKSIVHWRQNSGAMVAEYNGKKRFFRFMDWLFPKKGLKFLDIGGIMPDGRYFTIEVKATGKKPTTEQYKTMEFIRSKNAIAVWADSIDMFIEKSWV